MKLITIPMSHYCEKARWALAHAGIAYVEEAHLQGFHYWAVRSLGSRGMVPVLIAGEEVVTDSSDILRFADRHLQENYKLYPSGSEADVDGLEDYFDEVLGVETRRWVYYHWLSEPAEEVMKIAAQLTPRWQQSLAPYLLPLLRVFLTKRLDISAANVESGLDAIAAGFDKVADRLKGGRRFLVGERFTAADLSFACMAGPILLPREYGIRLPTLEEAPVPARADILRFRAHPAGQFALRLFAERQEMGRAAQNIVAATR